MQVTPENADNPSDEREIVNPPEEALDLPADQTLSVNQDEVLDSIWFA